MPKKEMIFRIGIATIAAILLPLFLLIVLFFYLVEKVQSYDQEEEIVRNIPELGKTIPPSKHKQRMGDENATHIPVSKI